MRRKSRIKFDNDDRGVAVYTRKSRITNKGDSIGVQFKQSADYATSQLSLPEDYEFLRYEDKGLSGYYSDRPDFQRLLHDIEMGKIRAVACYKLDRISRKTSDLMKLLEFFERYNVTLLVCSNNINTQISTSKIIIQVLAIIAEFERDILTERIQDNLMELAKDGRWMGGTTPTGFTAQRVSTGSGRNKSAISFLVPIPEEKQLVQKLFSYFLKTRSLNSTAKELNKEYSTKKGAQFTVLAVKDILKNPIYCTADERAYHYFLENGANLFGDIREFNGEHGISAYNKTDQYKIEDDNSTFMHPRFVTGREDKPIEAWIVSVGKHEGIIPSSTWIDAQGLLKAIAERYNRPHRKTNALLSGVLYCPLCGKPLRVVPESNRWSHGKPRFKYVCPGFRKKTCTFKAVDGVQMDEFIVEQLSKLSDQKSPYYRELASTKFTHLLRADTGELEYQETEKAVEQIKSEIAAQVRNMRQADSNIRKYIQEDIEELSKELEKKEQILIRLRQEKNGDAHMTEEIADMKKRLLSFRAFADGATPEVLVTLIQTLVERIYIVYDNEIAKCHVFVKGCAAEEYSELLGPADYISICAVFSLPASVCDCDRYREHHPHPQRRSAAAFVPPHHGGSGP